MLSLNVMLMVAGGSGKSSKIKKLGVNCRVVEQEREIAVNQKVFS